MPAVTNTSSGPRGFSLPGGERVTLAPGETRDLPIDPAHPVHAAWAAAGEIRVAPTGQESREPAAAPGAPEAAAPAAPETPPEGAPRARGGRRKG